MSTRPRWKPADATARLIQRPIPCMFEDPTASRYYNYNYKWMPRTHSHLMNPCIRTYYSHQCHLRAPQLLVACFLSSILPRSGRLREINDMQAIEIKVAALVSALCLHCRLQSTAVSFRFCGILDDLFCPKPVNEDIHLPCKLYILSIQLRLSSNLK